MTKEAPVSVAECPPLGVGGTPSIYGNAQSHLRSAIEEWRLQNWTIIWQSLSELFLTIFFLDLLLLGLPLAIVVHHLLTIAHFLLLLLHLLHLHHLLLLHVKLLLLFVHLHIFKFQFLKVIQKLIINKLNKIVIIIMSTAITPATNPIIDEPSICQATEQSKAN